MMLLEYPSWDAIDIVNLIRKKEISAQEVLDSAIYFIDKYNPHLNAVINKLYEQANYFLSVQDPKTDFYGVPIVLKDLWADYKSVPTSCGSKLFVNNIPKKDSPVVTAFKRIGLNPIAKTNTPEFGLSSTTEPILYGPTKNPWNLSLSPGGSSGGTAAAVAARMVPAGHASDAGGSLRGPAACCGLFGLKPTNGYMIRCFNYSPLQGLGVEHVITRSVRDSKLIFAKLSLNLSSTEIKSKRLKIGILTKSPFPFKTISPVASKALDIAVDFFIKSGFECKPIQLPFPSELNLSDVYISSISYGTRELINHLLSTNSQKLNKYQLEVATYLIYLLGKNNRKSLQEINNIYTKLTLQIDQLFNQVDILVTPAIVTSPPKLGSLNPNFLETIILNFARLLSSPWLAHKLITSFSNEIFSNIAFFPLFNITGHPAATIPIYYNEESQMPISIQLIAPKWRESYIFDLAEKIEQFFPWENNIPNLLKERK